MSEHVIRLRDLRERFGDADAAGAECSCGWQGTAYRGRLAWSEARREGARHSDDLSHRRGRRHVAGGFVLR